MTNSLGAQLTAWRASLSAQSCLPLRRKKSHCVWSNKYDCGVSFIAVPIICTALTSSSEVELDVLPFQVLKRLTHPYVAPRKQTRHFGVARGQLLKKVRGVLPPSTITKILDNSGGEVVRNNSRNLDLGIRSDLPSYINQNVVKSQFKRCAVRGIKFAPFMKRASAA